MKIKTFTSKRVDHVTGGATAFVEDTSEFEIRPHTFDARFVVVRVASGDETTQFMVRADDVKTAVAKAIRAQT